MINVQWQIILDLETLLHIVSRAQLEKRRLERSGRK
jgi:hypothetical protein